MAVEVDGLTRRYGAFTAVDAVTFTVKRGEVFGFLGPNGAGKTTTIKMLTGLVRPTSGKGHVVGLDVSTDGERIKHAIGYMSQLFSLYHDLTVSENIVKLTRFHGRLTSPTFRDEEERVHDQITGIAPEVRRRV